MSIKNIKINKLPNTMLNKPRSTFTMIRLVIDTRTTITQIMSQSENSGRFKSFFQLKY